MRITWAGVGQFVTVWVIVAVCVMPVVRSILGKLRTRREFRGHLESERRRVRLEKLTDLADEYEAAPTDAARKRIFIKAESLGFTDGAFMLDEDAQPHLPKAS